MTGREGPDSGTGRTGTGGGSAAMAEEFDTVAEWTAGAVIELGHHHALPAACRGSGSPAALDWLVARLGLRPGTTLVDAGAGVGGPAAYAVEACGARPVLVEPMAGACRAARRLFGLPVAVGDGAALPFAGASFETGWSLGVLDTVEDKAAHLRELCRVVEGRVGLLVYLRTVPDLPDQPDGNHFVDREAFQRLLDEVGLRVFDETTVAELPDAPQDWSDAVTRVGELVAAAHSDDQRWQDAHGQQDVIVDLIERRLVLAVLLACDNRAGL